MDKNTNRPNDPDYASAAYVAMSAAWTIVSDVSGGTAQMRAKSTEYLPQEPAEQSGSYNRRLGRSVFFNAYSRTRDALVGMVFKSDLKMEGDVPEDVKNHLENIDLAGSHVDVFAKELFMDAFEGHAFILVDMPPALPEGSTRADEIQAKRRPYWVKYKACQALNWRTSIVNSETVLTQITFEEKTNEAAGEYGEVTVCRYRVFRLVDGIVTWTLYRKVTAGGSQSAIAEEDSGTISGLNRIPVAVVYGNRLGMLESSPPLLDLAYLNVRHWQNYSDYAHILHVAQVPLLARIGVSDQESAIEVSVARTIDIPDPAGDVKWIEVQGAGISAGKTELDDLERRMGASGLSMLTPHADATGPETATKIRASNLQESSDLATMARSLQDALEMALELHAKYLGLPSGGSIKLGVAESDLVLDGSMVTALSNAVGRGHLSLETFISIMQRAFSGVDLQNEIKKLEALSPFKGAPPIATDLAKMNRGVQKILAGGVQ